MKKRKKLIKRIGAVLCALVVSVSSFCGIDFYYASSSDLAFFGLPSLAGVESRLKENLKYGLSLSYEHILIEVNGIPCLVVGRDFDYIGSDVDPLGIYGYSVGLQYIDSLKVYIPVNGEWKSILSSGSPLNRFCVQFIAGHPDVAGNINLVESCRLLYSSIDICDDSGNVVYKAGIQEILPSYNSNLGYLMNVRHRVVFDDVPLGENVGETFTERWYYDNLSTTEVDLTNGDYMIRYYQEKWIVTGYGINDVVEKSERYVIGDFIVQNGYIENYSENIESTLAGQGYVEPSIFDLFWNKFVTTHYYFQIVNAKTNEVGGLLHVYLTDDNGEFGVEHIGETLDNDGNYDEGGYKDFIDEDKVTTDDVEQGFNDLENGSNVDFGAVDGVDELGVTLESFASQVSNVSSGVHALLSSMPPWVLGLLGVSFVLLVVGIIFKIV